MQQQASVLFPNGPDNTQFLKLLKSDTILFKQAIEKKSIICVPPDAYFSRAMTKYKPQQLLSMIFNVYKYIYLIRMAHFERVTIIFGHICDGRWFVQSERNRIASTKKSGQGAIAN